VTQCDKLIGDLQAIYVRKSSKRNQRIVLEIEQINSHSF